MRVTHEPVTGERCFGPYLGGRQARLAVSGLGRVLPLGYAADGAGGSHLDMARVRGVSAAGRAALADAVTAVLGREPGAVGEVRAGLAARRDAASAALAFEFAGRLQQEIEALDWIAGEQKVTRPGTGSRDVHGWADGVLVRFEVRDGYLSGWSQRACGEAAARRHLAGTPAGWAEFARRNAELAARLSVPGRVR